MHADSTCRIVPCRIVEYRGTALARVPHTTLDAPMPWAPHSLLKIAKPDAMRLAMAPEVGVGSPMARVVREMLIQLVAFYAGNTWLSPAMAEHVASLQVLGPSGVMINLIDRPDAQVEVVQLVMRRGFTYSEAAWGTEAPATADGTGRRLRARAPVVALAAAYVEEHAGVVAPYHLVPLAVVPNEASGNIQLVPVPVPAERYRMLADAKATSAGESSKYNGFVPYALLLHMRTNGSTPEMRWRPIDHIRSRGKWRQFYDCLILLAHNNQPPQALDFVDASPSSTINLPPDFCLPSAVPRNLSLPHGTRTRAEQSRIDSEPGTTYPFREPRSGEAFLGRREVLVDAYVFEWICRGATVSLDDFCPVEMQADVSKRYAQLTDAERQQPARALVTHVQFHTDEGRRTVAVDPALGAHRSFSTLQLTLLTGKRTDPTAILPTMVRDAWVSAASASVLEPLARAAHQLSTFSAPPSGYACSLQQAVDDAKHREKTTTAPRDGDVPEGTVADSVEQLFGVRCQSAEFLRPQIRESIAAYTRLLDAYVAFYMSPAVFVRLEQAVRELVLFARPVLHLMNWPLRLHPRVDESPVRVLLNIVGDVQMALRPGNSNADAAVAQLIAELRAGSATLPVFCTGMASPAPHPEWAMAQRAGALVAKLGHGEASAAQLLAMVHEFDAIAVVEASKEIALLRAELEHDCTTRNVRAFLSAIERDAAGQLGEFIAKHGLVGGTIGIPVAEHGASIEDIVAAYINAIRTNADAIEVGLNGIIGRVAPGRRALSNALSGEPNALFAAALGPMAHHGSLLASVDTLTRRYLYHTMSDKHGYVLDWTPQTLVHGGSSSPASNASDRKGKPRRATAHAAAAGARVDILVGAPRSARAASSQAPPVFVSTVTRMVAQLTAARPAHSSFQPPAEALARIVAALQNAHVPTASLLLPLAAEIFAQARARKNDYAAIGAKYLAWRKAAPMCGIVDAMDQLFVSPTLFDAVDSLCMSIVNAWQEGKTDSEEEAKPLFAKLCYVQQQLWRCPDPRANETLRAVMANPAPMDERLAQAIATSGGFDASYTNLMQRLAGACAAVRTAIREGRMNAAPAITAPPHFVATPDALWLTLAVIAHVPGPGTEAALAVLMREGIVTGAGTVVLTDPLPQKPCALAHALVAPYAAQLGIATQMHAAEVLRMGADCPALWAVWRADYCRLAPFDALMAGDTTLRADERALMPDALTLSEYAQRVCRLPLDQPVSGGAVGRVLFAAYRYLREDPEIERVLSDLLKLYANSRGTADMAAAAQEALHHMPALNQLLGTVLNPDPRHGNVRWLLQARLGNTVQAEAMHNYSDPHEHWLLWNLALQVAGKSHSDMVASADALWFVVDPLRTSPKAPIYARIYADMAQCTYNNSRLAHTRQVLAACEALNSVFGHVHQNTRKMGDIDASATATAAAHEHDTLTLAAQRAGLAMDGPLDDAEARAVAAAGLQYFGAECPVVGPLFQRILAAPDNLAPLAREICPNTVLGRIVSSALNPRRDRSSMRWAVAARLRHAQLDVDIRECMDRGELERLGRALHELCGRDVSGADTLELTELQQRAPAENARAIESLVADIERAKRMPRSARNFGSRTWVANGEPHGIGHIACPPTPIMRAHAALVHIGSAISRQAVLRMHAHPEHGKALLAAYRGCLTLFSESMWVRRCVASGITWGAKLIAKHPHHEMDYAVGRAFARTLRLAREVPYLVPWYGAYASGEKTLATVADMSNMITASGGHHERVLASAIQLWRTRGGTDVFDTGLGNVYRSHMNSAPDASSEEWAEQVVAEVMPRVYVDNGASLMAEDKRKLCMLLGITEGFATMDDVSVNLLRRVCDRFRLMHPQTLPQRGLPWDAAGSADNDLQLAHMALDAIAKNDVALFVPPPEIYTKRVVPSCVLLALENAFPGTLRRMHADGHLRIMGDGPAFSTPVCTGILGSGWVRRARDLFTNMLRVNALWVRSVPEHTMRVACWAFCKAVAPGTTTFVPVSRPVMHVPASAPPAVRAFLHLQLVHVYPELAVSTAHGAHAHALWDEFMRSAELRAEHMQLDDVLACMGTIRAPSAMPCATVFFDARHADAAPCPAIAQLNRLAADPQVRAPLFYTLARHHQHQIDVTCLKLLRGTGHMGDVLIMRTLLSVLQTPVFLALPGMRRPAMICAGDAKFSDSACAAAVQRLRADDSTYTAPDASTVPTPV